MTLIINGKSMEFKEKNSIQDILDKLNIESQVVAVSLNSQLVNKESYIETFPNNGDRIEMLQFMGGG